MHNMDSLTADLASLGIKNDDIITVHTSLKSIGELDTEKMTGADLVLDSLRYAVRDGLLLVPTHTYDEVQNTLHFDIRRSVPCIGVMPCVAAKRSNAAYDKGDKTVIRSFHPSHSLTAFGRDAREFTACDADTCTAIPMNGCYANILRHSGKILLIGVDLRRCTFIHLIDELRSSDIPFEYRYITATDYDGIVHPRKWCPTRGASYKYEKYRPCLDEADAIRYGKFGDAAAMLVDSVKCFDAIMKFEDEKNKQ